MAALILGETACAMSELKKSKEKETPTRNRERTRSLILAAATEEFSEKGFAGARIEKIAERSGSNKRMLYYYFQNKEELFLAVMEDTYKTIRDAESELRLLDLHPDAVDECVESPEVAEHMVDRRLNG